MGTFEPMAIDWNDFQGVNAGVVLELYDKYLADPGSVDEATRTFFKMHPSPGLAPPGRRSGTSDLGRGTSDRVVVAAVALAQSIRRYGHLAAEIDPLGSRPVGDPALLAATHGLTDEDLKALPASLFDGAVTGGAGSMAGAVSRLR